ncbi:polyketide synthase [Streptomyces tateyamensis]|uniref:Polyketide synthase n=1 Tax=Streptomyces tateyamensis TaxID=565073 RepID=A0A2V4NUF9_9ACTN|nr:acyl carrier protein [Streptomyces tateyamensis]PYC87366.1 polyketide synthase [Streptomyces tateyamensis]
MSEQTVETSVAGITAWLTERVAFFLETEPDQLRPDVNLVEYGMDSVYGMSLIAQIEDRFEVELSPTLAWDHPTIGGLAGHLNELVGV